MPVDRLDYTENRDGGNHGKFDVFLSKIYLISFRMKIDKRL